jgi:2-phospho-L-lactate guanylyltransferase
MTIAIVPVKHLSKGKTRLASRLDRTQLETLSIAMLKDILDALQQTPSIDRVAVVTPDISVAECANYAGAIGLLRDDPGLNASIDAAQRELAADGESSLVILGDVAGALATELEQLFGVLDPDATGAQVALAPSRDGGTAALLRAPAFAIPSQFGPNSGSVHRKLAEEASLPFHEVTLPSLSVDLDIPDDVDEFVASAAGGKETRRTLEALGWKVNS